MIRYTVFCLLVSVSLVACQAGQRDTGIRSGTSAKKQAIGHGMAIFAGYQGDWVTTVTGNAEEPLGEAVVRRVEWTGRFIEPGGLFEMRGREVTDKDEIEFIWTFAYDFLKQHYTATYADGTGTLIYLPGSHFSPEPEFISFRSEAAFPENDFLFKDIRLSLDVSEASRLKYTFSVRSKDSDQLDEYLYFERGTSVPK